MRVAGLITCVLLAATTLAACGGERDAAAAAAPPTWPLKKLEIGLMDEERGAEQLAAAMPLKLRYHYLAGGVNTPDDWTNWGRGAGRFASEFAADSRDHGMVPVFTWYQIRQSAPGVTQHADEPKAIFANLRNTGTMRDYFTSLRTLMERLGESPGPTVLHAEPDLWGYGQQHHGDKASSTYVAVAASGDPELSDLPNDLTGLAKAFVRLRDRHAPRTLLGYGLSIWGTDKDIVISDEPDASVDALAKRSVRFYKSLGTNFDVVFGEFSDRSSGYAQERDGRGADAWWTAADFRRHARFMKAVNQGTDRPLVMWQIPLGNTMMRSSNNQRFHYQDNRVQRLLSPANKYRNLRAYRDAGAVAMLFGPGQGEDTHALDRANDGVTNPAPVRGNKRRATVADDDGGYFRARVTEYVKRGPLRTKR